MSDALKNSSAPSVPGFRCQECHSDWPGYHSFSFCRLRKASLPWTDEVLGWMAMVADGRALAVPQKREGCA